MELLWRERMWGNMKDFIDKTGSTSGTPLNREAFMAIQGFETKNTVFSHDKIIETNSNGEKLTTVFNADGTITQTFVGEKTIVKTITLGKVIREVIS